MHFITGKQMPRRTFLRGLGATVALPFLDAMVPAREVRARAAAAATADPTRLVCIEEVHGLAGCNNVGAGKHLFAPATAGRDFTLVPDNPLSTIDAYRDYLTIVSNTDVRNAEAFALPEIGGDHFRSSAVFLTQSHPKQTQGSDVFAGTSMDQMYAKRFGQGTPMPSMQFCIENLDQAGGCTYNYSCAYTDTISWASPNEPLPMIRDPRVAFDMLFGAGATPADRAARMATRRSILDWISTEITQVRRQLGTGDRTRLDRYLDNVREVERRIEAVEAHNRSGEPREMPTAPAGVPDSFSEHMKLLFDLQVLALQSDMTRIISFKTGRDAQNRVFPESGSTQPFHPASHHGNREERIMEFNKICKYRVSQLAYFLERMKTTMDGDASLLDKTLIVWGSPMADPNIHNHRRCPLILLGYANGHLKGNLHLKAEDGTPMANVMLTLMHNLGLDSVKTFGDSTGEFSLSAPTTTTVAG
ncbi:MAG: hypothetical protein DMF91_05940 [Acidobacteria bacterium]|nr:MAG: hypothetical protein DMF91_05940 [Acidobacteriota bacterium]